jgi:uncharacterized LabA/DUF88 family protein
MNNVAVFLDYGSIAAQAESNHAGLHFGSFLSYLADIDEGRNLKVAYAYAPIDSRNPRQSSDEISKLWAAGYIVREKALVNNSDFKVEMTLDIMKTCADIKPDIMVLVTGDADFVPVVAELRQKGIRVEVAAFQSAMSDMLSKQSSGTILIDALAKTPEPPTASAQRLSVTSF